jgi:hypothetical protein
MVYVLYLTTVYLIDHVNLERKEYIGKNSECIISAKSYWSFVPFLSSCACAFQLSLDIVWLHLCSLPSDYELEQVFFTESCCSHSQCNVFVRQVFGCCSTYQCVCFLG